MSRHPLYWWRKLHRLPNWRRRRDRLRSERARDERRRKVVNFALTIFVLLVYGAVVHFFAGCAPSISQDLRRQERTDRRQHAWVMERVAREACARQIAMYRAHDSATGYYVDGQCRCRFDDDSDEPVACAPEKQ